LQPEGEDLMPGLLFVAQRTLDSWAERGKIDFVGDVMTLLGGSGKGRSYALDPAVRFMRVVGEEADPNGLLHKVKSRAQLKELGAEQVDSSVILGDVAYEVEPGFLAEASILQAAASSRAAPPPEGGGAVEEPATAPAGPAPSAAPPLANPYGAQPLPRELEDRRKEAEALAKFLLDNLL
jgi:hypothetical protein